MLIKNWIERNKRIKKGKTETKTNPISLTFRGFLTPGNYEAKQNTKNLLVSSHAHGEISLVALN